MAIKDAKFRITAEDATDVAFRKVNNSLLGVERAAGMVTGALGALGVGFGAVQAVRFAKGIIDDADALSKLSQKTHIAVAEVAGWAHALDLANVPQEALQKTAKSLSSQMLDASMGLIESKRNFAALDIGIRNTDGSLRSVDAVLLDIADKYARSTDKTAAMGLMTKLLGKSALDLIPAFKDGRDALELLIEEGKRYNPITEESARAAEQFNDNLTRLSKSIKSDFIVAMNKGLPALAEMSDNLTRASNQGHTFLGIMRELAKIDLALLGKAIPALEGPTQRAFDALAAQSGTILRPGEVAGKIGGLKPAATFTPKIGDPAETAARKKALADAAKEYDWLISRLQEGDDEWQKSYTEAWQAYETTVKKATEGAAADYAKQWQQIFDEIDADQARAIEEGQNYLDDLEEKGKDTFKSLEDAVRGWGSSFTDTMADAFMGVKVNATDMANSVIRDLLRMEIQQSITKPLFDWAGPALSKAVSSILPGRAAGGPVSAGSAYMVGERGPEMFIPRSSGNIVPNGGGGGIVIQQHMTFGSDVDRATLMRWGEAVKQQTLGAVIDLRRRNPAAFGA